MRMRLRAKQQPRYISRRLADPLEDETMLSLEPQEPNATPSIHGTRFYLSARTALQYNLRHIAEAGICRGTALATCATSFNLHDAKKQGERERESQRQRASERRLIKHRTGRQCDQSGERTGGKESARASERERVTQGLKQCRRSKIQRDGL